MPVASPLKKMRRVQVRRDQYLVRCRDCDSTHEPRAGYLGWRPVALPLWESDACGSDKPGTRCAIVTAILQLCAGSSCLLHKA